MKNKSLGINAVLNGIRSVLNLLFPLITFPYISRVLSISGMGIYNFSGTYVNYFILIAGLGISTYAIREGAKYRDNLEKIEKFSDQIFSINIISTLVAYILLAISLIIFKNLNNYISCILIFSIQILFTTIGVEWIYVIYEDYTYITIRSILFKIISLILLFTLVKKSTDYLIYAGITVLASVGSNLLNFVNIKKKIHIKFTKSMNWKRHIRPIMVLFASALAINIYVSSDITILGILKNDYAVGIYGTSVKIYQMIEGLLSAGLTVTIPRLALLWGKKKTKEYNDILFQVISVFEIFVLPVVIGLIMLGQEIVLIIAGNKYLPSVSTLYIISWAIIFSIFNWIFSDCVLIPVKRENIVLKNNIITAVENIALNFLLIPIFSYKGAAISTVIAELTGMLLDGYASKDIINSIIFRKSSLKNIFDSMLGCICIVLACILVKSFFKSLTLRTTFSVISSVGIYITILILLKNNTIISVLKKMKRG